MKKFNFFKRIPKGVFGYMGVLKNPKECVKKVLVGKKEKKYKGTNK